MIKNISGKKTSELSKNDSAIMNIYLYQACLSLLKPEIVSLSKVSREREVVPDSG